MSFFVIIIRQRRENVSARKVCFLFRESPLIIIVISHQSESMTFSIIVLSGGELKGSITFDGPIATDENISAGELWEASESYRYDPAKRNELIVFGSLVDFEHLNPIKNREVHEDEEEEEEVVDEEETVAERRARRARERKRALEKRQREQEDLMHQRKHVRMEGDPFQKTYKSKANGWYRFCVTASWNAVDVEVDLRREKELGGVGPNGHVYTLEEKTLAEEEDYMEEDTAEKEGIKDEDFQATRDKLKSLRRLLGTSFTLLQPQFVVAICVSIKWFSFTSRLTPCTHIISLCLLKTRTHTFTYAADISNRQQKERHRIQLHSATNEHSHSRMVLSSLFQTVLFCAVTGYQVFTIRRWFKGAPALG